MFNLYSQRHTEQHKASVRGTEVSYLQTGNEHIPDWIKFDGYPKGGVKARDNTFLGPKLHITMKEFHPEALEMLVQLAMDHGITKFKVIQPDKAFFDTHPKRWIQF